MVISPEHAFIKKWVDAGLIRNADAVAAYQEEAARKSDFERTELNKEKTGVVVEGVKGINPVNGKEIPCLLYTSRSRGSSGRRCCRRRCWILSISINFTGACRAACPQAAAAG